MTFNDVPDFVPLELSRLGLCLDGPSLERALSENRTGIDPGPFLG